MWIFSLMIHSQPNMKEAILTTDTPWQSSQMISRERGLSGIFQNRFLRFAVPLSFMEGQLLKEQQEHVERQEQSVVTSCESTFKHHQKKFWTISNYC